MGKPRGMAGEGVGYQEVVTEVVGGSEDTAGGIDHGGEREIC